MIISSPSQVLIKTVDDRRTKSSASKGNCPVSGTVETIEDLERIVADLDRCVRFSDIHRIIVNDVADIRYLIPWLQRESVLEQASKLLSSTELASSSLSIRKRCAKLYLIIFSVYVILHDKRLQLSVLRSLTTVNLCFDLLIGAHVNLYRMRPLEDSGRFSPEMSNILEQLMGLDEFMHEFDRLELFDEYQKKETEYVTRQYVPPQIPAEYSIEVYTPRDLSIAERSNPTLEPVSKKIIENGKKDTEISSSIHPLFNFHLLKTNALSTFDLSVYSFLSTTRLRIYQELLRQTNKEHLLENDIRRFQKLFSLLVYVNRDTSNKEVCKYLEQLFETVSSLITYTRICRFIFEITEANQFSMSEISLSCSTPHTTKAPASTAVKPSANALYQALRNISAAIASCIQQMLQFVSWLALESPRNTDHYTAPAASDSASKATALFQQIYEKILSLIEEIFMCRAYLCFTLFQADEEMVRSLAGYSQYDSTMASYTLDDEGQSPKEDSIEYELLRSLYCTGEDVLLESKGVHAAVTNSIDCSALYTRKPGEKGQILIHFYGLLPQLLYCLLYLMNLANVMLPGPNHSRVSPIVRLIEPTVLIITTIFGVLHQNNKSFCRTQLGEISLFLKRFSQAIEAILSTIHTASRAIHKRIRASQESPNDNTRMEIYKCIINAAFKVLQNMFEAGVVVLDQKLLVMGIRYITSFVSPKSFCAACRILMHLLPYKEMRDFAERYTLDGKPVGEYLAEKTRPLVTDSACLNSLDALLLLFGNK